MTVTFVVVLVAATAAVLAFACSAVRGLPDPIDPSGPEGAVVRGLARHPRLQRFLRQRMDRRTAGGFVLTAALLAALAAGLLVGGLLDMVDGAYGLAALDDDVAQWGVANADSATVDILKGITYLGDTVVVVAALIVSGLIDYHRHRRVGVVVFLTVLIGGEKVIVNGLKELVDRGRPDILPLVGWEGPSFPSGHAAAAAAVWPAIALVLGRGGSRAIRALLAAAAALIAIGVAASRAMLGVHWLTDIVAGLAIGYCWFFICAVMFGGRAYRLGDLVTAHTRSVVFRGEWHRLNEGLALSRADSSGEWSPSRSPMPTSMTSSVIPRSESARELKQGMLGSTTAASKPGGSNR